MSLHKRDDGKLEFTSSLREWTETPCCVDGWVMGSSGIQRCDDCKRFEDDEDAAKHIARVVNTFEGNGYITAASAKGARSLIRADMADMDRNEEEDDDDE